MFRHHSTLTWLRWRFPLSSLCCCKRHFCSFQQYQYVTLIARFNPYVEVVVKGGRVMKKFQIMAVNGKVGGDASLMVESEVLLLVSDLQAIFVELFQWKLRHGSSVKWSWPNLCSMFVIRRKVLHFLHVISHGNRTKCALLLVQKIL